MNEKLSRPQFNQMDTTEKQTLMESLAARYTMTFLDLHTFDRWGQSSTTGIFEKDGPIAGEWACYHDRNSYYWAFVAGKKEEEAGLYAVRRDVYKRQTTRSAARPPGA